MLNQNLLSALRRGLELDNREEIFNLVKETGAFDHWLFLMLDNPDLEQLVNSAIKYVALSAESMWKKEPTWGVAYSMSVVNEGLNELVKNPALEVYTVMIMALALALVKSDMPEPV